MKIPREVLMFNDGDWDDISSQFNGKITAFLKYAKLRNALDEVDLTQIPQDEFPNPEFLFSLGVKLTYEDVPDSQQDKVLLFLLEKDPQKTLKYICDYILDDVEIRGSDYYLRLGDREDLSVLYCDYRDTSPKDIANSILSEDGEMWDPFWDTTDDVYRDVIEVLDKENLDYLCKYLVKNFGNQPFYLESYKDSEFLSSIANEEGIFYITTENVHQLVRDEEIMNVLLKNEFSDLKSELYSVHNNAYNGAYSDDIYSKVMGELDGLFDGKFLDEERTRNEKTYYIPFIKIKDFYSDVHLFLTKNSNVYYNDSRLYYHGSYLNMISNLMENGDMECLDFRIPDYPDSDKVDEYINEHLGDYI